MEILLATRNDHKLVEIQALLSQTNWIIHDLRAFPELPDELPETGNTFVDNALQKARFVYQHTGRLSVADDSGIEVDALNGAPGVFSKRFSQEGTDEANNRLLIEQLTTQTVRSARYRCVIAVVGPTGECVVEGKCEGRIVDKPRGSGGFGYDPHFEPIAYPGRTMAELTMAEKNTISHRGEAVRALSNVLAKLNGGL